MPADVVGVPEPLPVPVPLGDVLDALLRVFDTLGDGVDAELAGALRATLEVGGRGAGISAELSFGVGRTTK